MAIEIQSQRLTIVTISRVEVNHPWRGGDARVVAMGPESPGPVAPPREPTSPTRRGASRAGAVLAASVWTYLVRDTGRDSIHRREADTEASTPTDSNISV